MDIILLVFLIAALTGVRFYAKESNPMGLHDQTSLTALRGMMAIAIILHHLSEHTSGGRFFGYLVHVGYLAVAIFLFLSGYGLMRQLLRKKRLYLMGFWRQRILPLVIIYLLTTVLYATVKTLNGTEVTLKGVLLSFVNGSPTASNSWYIIVQLMLYVVFWVAFTICGEHYKKGVALVILAQIGMLFVFRVAGFSSIWYLSNFSFSVGLLWAYYDDWFTEIMKRSWLPAVLLALLLFAVFSGIPLFVERIGGNRAAIGLLCRFASTVSFALLVAGISYRVRFTGKVWNFLGECSLEIYLLHGMVYYLLRSNLIYVKNDVLWSACTVAFSIAVAVPAFLLNRQIKKVVAGKR